MPHSCVYTAALRGLLRGGELLRVCEFGVIEGVSIFLLVASYFDRWVGKIGLLDVCEDSVCGKSVVGTGKLRINLWLNCFGLCK